MASQARLNKTLKYCLFYVHIGKNPLNNRKTYQEWRAQVKNNKELEKAARKNTLDVDLEDIKKEHENSGGLFSEIKNAAEMYGIFEDLFDHSYFNPIVNLTIEYDFEDDIVTPVFRGNVIKPKEAKTPPHVHFESDENSLWTLILTNPDGHFTENESEYIHWMVTNIKGNDINTGQVIAPYLQPFPPSGTGFHRFVFILFKQVRHF